MKDTIKKLTKKHLPYIIELRRTFHENPELGYEEFETTKMIKAELNKIGIELCKDIMPTGAVGLLRSRGSRTIALRADIDALPIHENTRLPFSSKFPGKMHACGHDAHTAICIGTAMVLAEIKQKLNGNVKFIFQPAEECSPKGGAKFLVEQGVLQNPTVETVLGLHVWPDLKTGVIGFRQGPLMAASDRFFIRIIGKKGHAAVPYKATDANMIGVSLLTGLNTFFTRNFPPGKIMFNFGEIKGGIRANIISDKFDVKGSMRLLDESLRDKVISSIERITKNYALAHEAEYEIKYDKGYPLLVNDPVICNKLNNIAKEVIGGDNVINDIPPTFVAEDFGYYSNEVPGAFFFLGCNRDKDDTMSLHQDDFILDEAALEIGIAVMAYSVVNMLK